MKSEKQSLLSKQETGPDSSINQYHEDISHEQTPIYSTETNDVIEGGDANMFSTIANVANSAVGAGVLSIPFAFRAAGLGAGIFILLTVSLLTMYSLRMIIFMIQDSKKFTYEQLVQHAFGKWFGYIMRAITVFVTTGAQTVYIVVLGDIVPPIIEGLFKHKVHWIFYNRTFVTAVIVVIFLIPCGMLRTLDALKYPSAIAVFAVIYLVFLVVLYRIIKPATDIINNETIQWINPSWDIFLSFPIIIYAHNCHVLVFPIMKEVHNPTHSRMEWSTRSAVFIYGGLYMLIGIVGYLSFFSKTKENILQNYAGAKFDIGLLMAQIGIGFTAIFSFPLQMYACRNSLNLIFFEGKPFSFVRHAIFALILIGFTFTLGTLVPKIGVVFGFIGASAGITVMFIMPSITYLKLIVFKDKRCSPKNIIYAILPTFIFCLGLVLAVVCSTVVIYTGIKNFTKPTPADTSSFSFLIFDSLLN